MPLNRTKTRLTAQLLSAALAIAILPACASTMSKKDCESADLYKMGREDGASGKLTERLQKTTDECRAQGVAVAADKYQYGRQVGLAEYCTEGRAKDDAKSGKTDSLCLKEKVPPYQMAYHRELDQHRAEMTADLEKLRKSNVDSQKKQAELQQGLQRIDQQKSAVPST